MINCILVFWLSLLSAVTYGLIYLVCSLLFFLKLPVPFFLEKLQVRGKHSFTGHRTTSSRGFCKYWCCWRLQTYKKGKGKFITVYLVRPSVLPFQVSSVFLLSSWGSLIVVVGLTFFKTNFLTLFFLCSFLKNVISWFFFLFMQSSYGFVHYFDRRSAALAILSLNGRHL